MYIEIKNDLKTHIIKFVNVIITTMFNFDDSFIYKIFKFHVMIVDEVIKTIELNMWNFFENYVKIFLIMIENEIQLRLMIFNDEQINEFVKFLRMFLFYRFKLLKQSSVLFSVQYQMMNVIEIMILKLFYVNWIINDAKTKTSIHTLTQNLI